MIANAKQNADSPVGELEKSLIVRRYISHNLVCIVFLTAPRHFRSRGARWPRRSSLPNRRRWCTFSGVCSHLTLSILFQALDADGSGDVTFEEFMKFLATWATRPMLLVQGVFRGCSLPVIFG